MQSAITRRHLFAGLAATGAIAMTDTALFAGRAKKGFFDRTGKSIGLQLYTLGDEVAQDVDATLAKVRAIGFRNLQLPQLYGKSPKELITAADKADVYFSCIHLAAMPNMPESALSFRSPTQRIVDDLGALRIKNAVLPITLLPDNFRPGAGESFQTALARSLAEAGEDIWKRTAALLNEKASALVGHGIQVGYHNHNMEFAPVGKTTGWDILLKETDAKLVKFEVDVGWVKAAGHDPVKVIKKLKGRMNWMHMKDVQASTKTNYVLQMDPTEVGSGIQDWPAILAAAHKAGCQNYYVEQEAPFTMARIDAAAKGYAFLRGVKA